MASDTGDGHTLARDVRSSTGCLVAPRGFRLSIPAIAEAAANAERSFNAVLRDGLPPELLASVLENPAHTHLFPEASVREEIEALLLTLKVPSLLLGELEALRGQYSPFLRHGITTAAISIRIADLAERPVDRSALALASIFHDIGMSYVDPPFVPRRGALTHKEALEVAMHPLTGALSIALSTGPHLAVDVAIGHHWRGGSGYPELPAPPTDDSQIVAVASAFAALTCPRPFRSAPYTGRAAIDLLLEDMGNGMVDGRAMSRLVLALRKERSDGRPLELIYGSKRPVLPPVRNDFSSVFSTARHGPANSRSRVQE